LLKLKKSKIKIDSKKIIIENVILKKINFSKENLSFFAIKIFLKFTERIFNITISIDDMIENFEAKIYC
jgi:hypothetical protein